jgi:hypothetical protein
MRVFMLRTDLVREGWSVPLAFQYLALGDLHELSQMSIGLPKHDVF